MAMCSKERKPDNFHLHKSLKLSFTNVQGLRSSFVEYESFLELNSPDIHVLCETNLDDSVDSGNFSILGPTYFLLYINGLSDDVICNIGIYVDDTKLYSKFDQASDQWQQLELASELESDLRDTVHWGSKWLINFNAGRTQLFSFGQPNNTDANDVKIDGSVLEGKLF